MKSVLRNIVLIAATVSVVSCSSNSQKENTGIGVATGAVIGGLAGSAIGGGTGKAVAIGAGIVVGALVGGAIGSSMDSTDKSNVYTSLQTGQPMTWQNANTKTVYTVTPSSNYVSVNGNPNCRQYTTVVQMKGKTRNVHGVACLRSDGAWHTVNN